MLTSAFGFKVAAVALIFGIFGAIRLRLDCEWFKPGSQRRNKTEE
jgi:hypothetical protein